jgi:uncharacterized damage-inducible protein DinB
MMSTSSDQLSPGKRVIHLLVHRFIHRRQIRRSSLGRCRWQDRTVTWTLPNPAPVDGPLTGADRPMLTAYLAWQRETLLNISAGLTGEQLASRPLVSSNLSLLGLIRHAAKVERIWFRERAAGEPIERMYGASPDKDADFNELDAEEAEPAVRRLREEWRACDAAAAGLSFEHEVDARGDAMSLRMVYIHLIGEYARHNGHADMLREAIDGATAR